MSTRPDEGRRVVRNVASFGAFVFSPLLALMLNRALGPDGYGHWWWTFGLLEAAAILGNFGTDLYVRREVPRLRREGRGEDEVHAVVGSGIAVTSGIGVVLALLQTALTEPLVHAQGAGLRPFLLILAWQPLLWNVTALLAGALQSIHVIGPVALVRGIVAQLLTIGVLYLAWILDIPTVPTLVLLILSSVTSLVIIARIYARHFSLSRTAREVVRAVKRREALAVGVALFVPGVLFTVGGKIDVYVLGAYVDAPEIGVYAACLTLAATLAATRALFDPIVLTQIAALRGGDDHELRASLARMTRMLALALSIPLVGLIAVGEPLLMLLLGREAPGAMVPLAIACAGQLIGGLAIAGWLVPMALQGRALASIAAITLLVKTGLLFLLVPPFGITGAAITAAVGTVIAQQAQVWAGARILGFRPYEMSLVPVLATSAIVAVLGHALFDVLAGRFSLIAATVLAGATSMLVLAAALYAQLTSDERRSLARLIGRTPREE